MGISKLAFKQCFGVCSYGLATVATPTAPARAFDVMDCECLLQLKLLAIFREACNQHFQTRLSTPWTVNEHSAQLCTCKAASCN